MLIGEAVAEATLTDRRKLAQGLHARDLIDDFGTAARFVTAIGEAGDALGHHPSMAIGTGYVDLKLVSADAICRNYEGAEHVVEWATRQDADLARPTTEIAAGHEVDADPASVSVLELGLHTAHPATIAGHPVPILCRRGGEHSCCREDRAAASSVLVFEGRDVADGSDSRRYRFTGGGAVEADEFLLDAASRELEEEAGQSGLQVEGPFQRGEFDFLNHGSLQHQAEYFSAARTDDRPIVPTAWTGLEK